MNKHSSLCVLCFTTFESSTSYGICSNCYGRDKLREFDRLETALHAARRAHLPAQLTLIEWISIINDFSGYCAYCLVEPFDHIEMVMKERGMVKGNVAPICRSCLTHRRDGWATAVERVQRYLSGEEGDLVAKRFPVFDESEVE